MAGWVAPAAREGTTPVHRLYSSAAGDHFLTAGESEAMPLKASAGWKYEGTAFYAWKSAGFETVDEAKALQPVFRFYSPSSRDHFLTMGETERYRLRTEWQKAWTYEGVAFYAYPSEVPGTMPVHRFCSAKGGDHFLTASEGEASRLKASPSWKYEGVAFWADDSSREETTPVHRFYSSADGDHFLTAGAGEADRLRSDATARKSWRYEGVAFHAWASPR